MKIHYGVAPPNFNEILAVLPDARKDGIIFAYAPDVYVPYPTGKLHQSLVAHEKVHIRQQLDFAYSMPASGEVETQPIRVSPPDTVIGPEGWWDLYLKDGAFRFDQELEAHRAEYAWWRKHKTQRIASNMLDRIAERLASGLYGMPKNKEWCRRFIVEQGKNAFKVIEPDEAA
jgi:hypothetical protein